MNRRDLAEFRVLWADEGVWEIGEPRTLTVSGASTIAETWSQALAGTKWLFRGSFAGVTVINGDEATGRWPCVETGTFKDGRGYHNRAFYSHAYVRRDGRWLFLRRHYNYL